MSMKKSLLLMLVVIIGVTIFSVISADGNSMDIKMGDDALTLSGIGNVSYVYKYADILEASIGSLSDYLEAADGPFLAQQQPGLTLFVATQCDTVVVCDLIDGGQLVFNYNSPSGTEGIYEMLLKNLK